MALVDGRIASRIASASCLHSGHSLALDENNTWDWLQTFCAVHVFIPRFTHCVQIENRPPYPIYSHNRLFSMDCNASMSQIRMCLKMVAFASE